MTFLTNPRVDAVQAPPIPEAWRADLKCSGFGLPGCRLRDVPRSWPRASEAHTRVLCGRAQLIVLLDRSLEQKYKIWGVFSGTRMLCLPGLDDI